MFRKEKDKDKVNEVNEQVNVNMSWEQEQEERKKRRRNRMIKIGLLIGIIIVILLMMKSCDSGIIDQLPDPVKEVINIGIEDTQEGEIEIDREEIQKRLNEEAMKSMLTIEMNKVPVFENGKAEGNLNIVNDKRNYYDFFVEIYRDDTNERIYQSKVIKVGTYLQFAKLNVPLEKGVYECTAVFKAVHPEESTSEGQANAKITITILN